MNAIYQRTIRLADTDAAGVIYFTSGLSICHEAYENALQDWGVDLNQLLQGGEFSLPIVRAEIDFLRPVFWGDRLQIELFSKLGGESRLDLFYEAYKVDLPAQPVMTAKTVHLSIHPQTRQQCPLPPMLREAISALTIRTL